MTTTTSQLRDLFNSQRMWRSETDRRRYDFAPFNEIVDIHASQIISYNEHLQVLLKRCASTAHLLEQLIWSKNQKLTREQSSYVLTLTKAAADDSAAIRVITVITLIYLSSTVVAVSWPHGRIESTSLCANNIFQNIMATPFFEVKHGHLRVSRQVWIYVVIALPLTIATLVYWRWRLRKRSYRPVYGSESHASSEKLPA